MSPPCCGLSSFGRRPLRKAARLPVHARWSAPTQRETMTTKTTKAKAPAKKPAAKPRTKQPTKPKDQPAIQAPSAEAAPAPVAPPAPSPHPGGDNYVRLPPQEPGELTIDYVRRNFPFVEAAYTMGNGLAAIGESFDPQLTSLQLRVAIHSDVDMHKRWTALRDHRAHFLVEEATESALRCSFHKERVDSLLKVAEKTAPHLYGAKSTVALTGADGGPIESKVEMSPTEAYQRMCKGT